MAGSSNDEEQFKMLMDAGVSFAQEYSLVPGIALTPEQMALLSSDIVWLVEQPVQQADGTVQNALVPQVYVRVQEGDLQGNGSLIAANTVNVQSSGSIVNSATIAGRTAVVIDAQNIRNIDGRIQGKDIGLKAAEDILNQGGQITAQDNAVLQAGRNIVIESTTHKAVATKGDPATVGSLSSIEGVDRMAAVYAGKGQLIASAGGSINLQAAQLQADQGSILLDAGNAINLQTVATGETLNYKSSDRNYHNQTTTQDIGTSITAAGNIQLQSGQDINSQGAQIASEKGAIHVLAGRDVNITASQKSVFLEEASYVTSKHFGSKTSRQGYDKFETTQAQGSRLSAENLNVLAGRDIGISGSEVVASKGLNLQAGNNIAIEAAQNSHSETHIGETKKSGLMGTGGVGFTIGKSQESQDATTRSSTAAASTVGSVEGNVAIKAGNTYTQTGSNVVAPKGNITVVAQDIAIQEARESRESAQETKFKQSGLSVSVSAPVISAVQMGQQMSNAASNTSDGRMQALAAGATALYAVNNAGQIADSAKALGNGDVKNAGVTASITVGNSKSSSTSRQEASNAAGSQMLAGGDITLLATGKGLADEVAGLPGSNILIQGSQVQATGNTTLAADNDINILAAKNTFQDRSNNKSSSAAVGVAVTFGQGGASFGVTASASKGKGHANSDELTHTNSVVEAGKTLAILSGADTNIKGAQLIGDKVQANIGGNLNIESQQDSSVYDSKQENMGGSVTVGVGFSGSANYSKSKAKGDYLAVSEQTGIYTGDGGYDIQVAGNTDLKGAVIASTQAAVDANKNSLVTGTLTHSDIENHSNYKASGFSVGGGFSAGGTENGKDKQLTESGNLSLSNQGKSGVRPGGAGYSSKSGSDSTTTMASISQGQITITNEADQQALTGQSAAETLESLNRQVVTGDDSTAGLLAKTWDGEKLRKEMEANAQIMAAFGEQSSKAWGNYANDKFIEAVNRQDEQAIKCWSADGACRVAGHGLLGGVAGGVPGAIGAGVSTLTAPQMHVILTDIGVPDGVAQGLTVVGAGTLGGVAGGGAGAASGYNEAANNAVWFIPVARFALVKGGEYSLRKCIVSPACVNAVGVGFIGALASALDVDVSIPGYGAEDLPLIPGHTGHESDPAQLPGLGGQLIVTPDENYWLADNDGGLSESDKKRLLDIGGYGAAGIDPIDPNVYARDNSDGKQAKKMTPNQVGEMLGMEDWHERGVKRKIIRKYEAELRGSSNFDFYKDGRTGEVYIQGNKNGSQRLKINIKEFL